MHDTNNNLQEMDGGSLMHISTIIKTATPYFPKEAKSSLIFLASILDFMASFKLYSRWHVPINSLPEMLNSVDYDALLNAIKPCLSKNEAGMVDAYFNFRQMSNTWKTAMEISSLLGNEDFNLSDMFSFSNFGNNTERPSENNMNSCGENNSNSRNGRDAGSCNTDCSGYNSSSRSGEDTGSCIESNADYDNTFSNEKRTASGMNLNGLTSFLTKEQLETYEMLKELLQQE